MIVRTILTVSLSLLLAASALAAPTKLAQQGRVLDSVGEPLEGTHLMVFQLFDAAIDGSAVWTEERSASFEGGYYSIILGEQVPLDDLVFAGDALWLEVAIDGETLTPRQEVVSVPYALRATAAEHVEGGLVDAEEISVDGSVVIDAAGNWVGPTPGVGWGDLSGVPADIADGDQDSDTLAGLACAEGQLPKWDATNSLWICGDDIDTDTTDPNTDTLQLLACATGQVAKWDGVAWSCGDDIDTDTTDPNTDTLAGLPCADGYIAKVDGSTGLWACAPDADSFAELAGACLPGDIPVLDPFSGSWTCGLDNDTVTTSLPWSSITGIPSDIADGDQDTVTLTLPWSSITGIPSDIVDGDQDTDTLASLVCGAGQGPKWDGTAWICEDDQDTNTQLTEAQVDAFAANNGYLSPDAAGNVGIGTATPTEKLTVDGTIESTSGGVRFPDGSLQTTAAVGSPAPGTVLYTRCAWNAGNSASIGSCTPPSCPTGWADLGVTGNVKTGVSTGGNHSSNSGWTVGSGHQERACFVTSSLTILTTRCAWTAGNSASIGSCTPPPCPSGWTDQGITGNVKSGVETGGNHSSNSGWTVAAGHQERSCSL